MLPSLLWQRMLLNLLWSSCSKSGTSAANRWRSSITPQKSSWRYRSPVEAPRVQKTFIDDFPLPLAATCRTREAPEEVLLAILGGHSPLEEHVILEHDALVVYQRHGHGDQSLQRCEYHYARAGASEPSRAIVAFGGNLLAPTIKLQLTS